MFHLYGKNMLVHVRSVLYMPDRKTDEMMGKSKAPEVCVRMGDISFDLLELRFEFQSILGSCSHFFFAKDLPTLSSNQDSDLLYFIHGPRRGKTFCLLCACRCNATGAGSCEVLSSRLFWQVLMCWGSNH